MMRPLLVCSLIAACSPQKGDAGPIGSTGPTGPTGAMGATGPAASPAPGLVRTVIVSPVGTTAQNGAALVQALAGITADADHPALLSLEPGNYDVGALPLAMKSFVDVEGSGEGTTTLSGSGGETITAAAMQMRFVTVSNSTATGAAVRAKSASGFSLTHVTLAAKGVGLSVEDDGFITLDNLTVFVIGVGTGIRCTTSKAAGPNINFRDGFVNVSNGGGDIDGINAQGCSLELDGVELNLTGQSGTVAGIRIADTGMSAGDLRLSDAIVEATCTTCTLAALSVSGGAQGANADVWSSRLRTFGNTPVSVALTKGGAGPATVNIADTLLGGAINNSGGTYHCTGNYDGSFAAVNCP
jgi:hypothetical protein